MDNVLIALDLSVSGFWLVYHAVSLRCRVNANIFILMVTDEDRMQDTAGSNEWIGSCENRLESLVAEECSKHARLRYSKVQGGFEENILEFVWRNDITVLVLAQPADGNAKKVTHFLEMVERISRQTSCRIEIAQKVWGTTDDEGRS